MTSLPAVNPRLKSLIATTVAVKALVLVLICAGYYLIPFDFAAHDANFIYPFGETATLRSAFKTWDANHYLYLANYWYSPFNINNAFYPLFPFLVRLAGYLVPDALVAGLAISTALTVLAVVYLYLLIRKTCSEEVAYRSCLVMLAFPTSFYCGLMYTESLFLLLSVMLLYYLGEERFAVAALCAFLLPLTRPTGILVIVPALAVLVLAPRLRERFTVKMLLVPAGFLAGYGAYLLVMKTATGDPFAGFDAQKVFQANNSLSKLFHPLDWFMDNFVHIQLTLNGFTTSIVNRAFFVCYAVIAAVSFKRLDPPLYLFLLVTGLIPAMTGSLTSYMRYLVVVFPLYVYLADRLKGKTIYWYLVPASILQALFLLAHASNRWVA